MPAAGTPGGILCVGDYPGRNEDYAGKPFVGEAGKYFRTQIKRWWSGPLAMTNAILCAPGARRVTPQHVTECRGYLTKTVQDVRPERIILVGGNAVHSVFGQSVPVLSVRRGYGWVWVEHEDMDHLVPVFILMNPVNSLRNRFLKQWFENDLRWALTCDVNTELQDPPTDKTCRIVETEQDALKAEQEITTVGGMTWDVETSGRPHNKYFKILCVGATAYGSESPWIWPEAQLCNPKTKKPLQRLLENPDIKKCGHNLKYDIHTTSVGLNIKMVGTDICTMLVRKLMWPHVSGKLEHMDYLVGMGGHKLEAQQALNKACTSITRTRANKGKAVGFLPGLPGNDLFEEATRMDHEDPQAFAYEMLNRELLHRYCALDVIATDRLRKWLVPQLEKQDTLYNIWNSFLRDTSEAVAQIEEWGMTIDRDAITAYIKYLENEVQTIETRLRNTYNIDPASPVQVADLLYDKLGLHCPRETATGRSSTDKKVLEGIKGKHKVVQEILDYRELSKFKSTYAEGLLKHVRDDGKVHSTYNIDGAASGRMSSSDPNVQNQPNAREGKDYTSIVRNCFVAPPGYTLVQLDYSQLELRIAALLSGDPVMKQIYINGEDYHRRTMEMICEQAWGITPEECKKEHRVRAKTINFSVIYMSSIASLARNLKCSEDEAAHTMNTLFGKMRKLKAYIDECIQEARQTGYTWTWWDGQRGRRRALYKIANNSDDTKDRQERSTAERGAWNTRPQGTASDFCLASLVESVKWIKRENPPAQLITTVHDSLLFVVRDDYVDAIIKKIRGIMTGWNSEDVPLGVDVETGKSWGNLKKYEILENNENAK